MPLDRRWVENIHARLLVRYGSPWINLYREIDPKLVISDWAEALNGFGPEAIRYALGCLPDDAPPNAAQFAKLCMRGPQSQAPALTWEKAADAAIVAQVMDGIKPAADRHRLQWARDLKARDVAGGKLTLAQRTMYRDALRIGSAA